MNSASSKSIVPRVLLVDDEPRATQIAGRMLQSIGCEVLEVSDATLALGAAREFRPDFALIDYFMPVLHGGDLAWQFASSPEFHDLRIVICSALPETVPTFRLPPRNIPIFAKPVSYAVLANWVSPSSEAAA